MSQTKQTTKKKSPPRRRGTRRPAAASRAIPDGHKRATRNSGSDRTQAALRSGEKRFQWLIENAPDIIYRFRVLPIPGFEYISPAVTAVIGYTPEEFYADPELAYTILHPDDRAAGETLRYAQYLPPVPIRLRWIHKNGKVVWTEHRVAPIYNKAGKLAAVEGIIRDITERKESEARLARNARQLEALGQVGQAVAASLDLTVVLKRVVEEMPPLLGADFVTVLLLENRDELVYATASGQAGDDFVNQRMPAQAGIAGEVVRTGQPVRVDDASHDPRVYWGVHQKVRKSTEGRPHSLLAVPLRLGDDVIGVMEAIHAQPGTFCEDDLRLLEAAANWAAIAIGNARLFEDERRRVEEQAALLDISQMALSSFALDRQVLKHIARRTAKICRAKRCTLFALDAAQSSVQPLMSQFADGHEDQRLWQAFQMIAAERIDMLPVFEEAARARRPVVVDEGQPASFLPEEWRRVFGIDRGLVVPLVSQGQVIGLLALDYDASHEFAINQIDLALTIGAQLAIAFTNAGLYSELEKALRYEKTIRAQLVQTEKLAAMGRLAASVAHELNNPLQAIQNALYLVKQENGLSDQAQADLDLVLTEARRMAELTQRMRETYRPATAEEFRPESLNSLVSEVQKLIEGHLRRNRVDFEFDPDPDLPNVPAIRDQLKQVILNLSLNAVEAMPEGGRLTVLTRQTPVGDGVWLMLIDTGTGIEPEHLSNIFDPFYTAKEGGTGLGLAITYDIVQRHKGRIEVDSEPGQGTTFRIWLPIESRKSDGDRGAPPSVSGMP